MAGRCQGLCCSSAPANSWREGGCWKRTSTSTKAAPSGPSSGRILPFKTSSVAAAMVSPYRSASSTEWRGKGLASAAAPLDEHRLGLGVRLFERRLGIAGPIAAHLVVVQAPCCGRRSQKRWRAASRPDHVRRARARPDRPARDSRDGPRGGDSRPRPPALAQSSAPPVSCRGERGRSSPPPGPPADRCSAE